MLQPSLPNRWMHDSDRLFWQPPTLGLRENEMRLATRMIKRGLPCLQLFGERTTDVRLSDRHADIYDSYADMFTILAVRTLKLRWQAQLSAHWIVMHRLVTAVTHLLLPERQVLTHVRCAE